MTSNLKKWINIVLIALIGLDVVYAVICFFFPQVWYSSIHGTAYVDPQGLLQRTGAIWATFAIFQVVTLIVWQKRPYWLAIAAGVRFSEILADWTYLLFAQNITLMGKIGLLAATPVNIAVSIFLLRAFLEMRPRQAIGASARTGAGEVGVFNRMQQDTFNQLIDAVIPPPDKRMVTPEQLTERFEKFIAATDDIPKDLIRTALDVMSAPLEVVAITAKGDPREALRSQVREALKSDDEISRNAARLLHVMITYLYYSDPRVDEQIGYVRFAKRARAETSEKISTSEIPVHNTVPRKNYDVCIVGSGVAGAMLANRLARKGKSVLVLDAGRYFPADKLNDDEFLMLAQLYKADVFQSALGGFPVIQAKCVGGGSVVNNAVCFRLPDWVKKDWDNFGAELDSSGLKSAFDRTESELKIRPADEIVRRNGRMFLNPSRDFFLRGVKALGIPHGTGNPGEVKPGFYTVSVNVDDCLGCGYCNIGCQYDRKVNTLTKLLPEALATGNCDVVEQAWVDSVATDFLDFGHLKANGLRVRLGSGEDVVVKARKYILSAGAIASSEILLKSFKVRLLDTPIGQRFSANAGTPLHAKFAEKVNAYDGLQISDYFLEKNERGTWDWIAETWFNPPGTESQAIPGHLDVHFERMQQFPHYAAIGMLVGTEPVGTIDLDLANRAKLNFELTDSDLQNLIQATRRCAEVFLAAEAEEVLLLTWNEMILKSKNQLDRIQKEIKKAADFMVISTGHPMGGNPMSDDKVNGRFQGVVGTDFKVHGVDDLFVCDASVFPTSIKVNPQWTVLALADLCSEKVLKDL